jgi:UDP-N-acetylmuramate dehydrogenase
MNNSVNTHKLYDLTTFKIGGEAKHFTVCGSIEELHECVTWCNNRDIPWFVLGGGSNYPSL